MLKLARGERGAGASGFGGMDSGVTCGKLQDSKKNSSRVIVNSGSAVGIKYRDGIMLISSPLVCYGSMKMNSDVSRFHVIGSGMVDLYEEKQKLRSGDEDMSSVDADKRPLVDKLTQIDVDGKVRFYEGKTTVIVSTGEFSDFQNLIERVEEKAAEDFFEGNFKSAKEYSGYISNVHYQKRNKMDPLLNDIIVAGLRKDATKEIYSVDPLGTRYSEDFIASGMAEYLAITLLRNQYKPDMSFDEAKRMLEDCMRNSFYIECKGARMVQIATINQDGTRIYPKYPLDVTWRYDLFVKPNLDRKDYLGF
ncbi:proteasome subunit beta7 and NTN hydrolase fold [Cryptosporidium canis]|uniref:Proteasome subunit beta7 and NTN hydrolase fold n=1 Tax=Cryptosporidium canis TaxID=195482 RepID=A0ABQ8P5V7_9CRYT|nr:proteasome subunit beta7 and NTN hydrolase fold [Cryptosporidium canis]KAJ1611088.1 proteasome subunit beta7 and NTN hydrolase fold [Cryptosporidium canis]